MLTVLWFPKMGWERVQNIVENWSSGCKLAKNYCRLGCVIEARSKSTFEGEFNF
jgi:hypothetical protein